MDIEQTNNLETFGLFIERLPSRIKSASLIPFDKIILVMDNASFHKSSFIRKLIEDKKVRIFTNAPHEPCLNPAEKLILVIKRKVKARRFQGRILSLTMVKAAVDEISEIRLERLVNASTFESLGKMKQQLI